MALTKNDKIRIAFSNNLKYYRLESKLTQNELAELTSSDLTVKYVSDLERNKYTPSLDTIDSLAKALKIEPYLLIKYDETHNQMPNRLDQITGTRNKKTKY